MTDLKPCPFCGGKAENSIGKTGDGKPWHYVECVDCGATGSTYGEYAAHNIAVIDWRSEQWNTRAEPDPEALVRAALERAARGAELFTGAKHTAFDIEAGTFPKQSYLGDAIAAEVRALASDPEAVAQIIKKAGEDRG